MLNSKGMLHSSITQKDILLVFPGKYRAPDPQVPLALLHIASPLQREGYQVRILDMRLEDYRNKAIGNPVFVGITCMSGQQIHYGLEFARKVRAESPSCPIVWGGVHPTLLPEQTAASKSVDVVVRGEGELVVPELANKLAAGETLDDVRGLTFKSEGSIKSTADADLIDLDDIPVELPYDLLKLEKYTYTAVRQIPHPNQPGMPTPLRILLQQRLQQTQMERQKRSTRPQRNRIRTS